MAEFTHHDPSTPVAAWEPWIDALPVADPLADVARLVVVAAHPDDETLGAGALMADAVQRGLPVRVIMGSDGEGSHPDSPTTTPDELGALRRRELQRGLRELGDGIEIEWLALADGGLSEHVDAICAAVRRAADDRTLIVSTYGGDGHPDHEAVALAAGRAAAETGSRRAEAPIWVRHWGAPDDLGGAAAVRVECDAETAERKRRALAAHASQCAGLSDQPGDEGVLHDGFLAHFAGAETFLTRGRLEGEMDAVHRSADPWGVDEHFYEARKRALTLAALPQARYERALELGCSVGALAADLAGRCSELVAVDASTRACAAARDRLRDLDHVRVERCRLPEQWPEGEWDLIVLSETGYYLTAAELDRLVERVRGSLRPGGTLLACHWDGPIEGWELDARRVHAHLDSVDFLASQASWRDPDFRLDVWTHGEAPSVAQRDGLRP